MSPEFSMKATVRQEPLASETRRTRTIAAILATILLLGYAALALTAAVRLPPTTDELLYIGASEGMLEGGWDSPYMRFQGPVGLYFNRPFARPFAEGKEHRQQVVTSGRLGMILAASLLGLGIFLWSRRLFGSAGGVLSLSAFCLNPLMIGYGAVVPVDMVHAGTTLLCLFLLWRYVRAPTILRAGLFGAGAGLLFATKYLAILLIPSLVLLAILYSVLRAGTKRTRALLRTCGHLLTATVAVFLVLHASYLFSVDFAPGEVEGYESARLQRVASIPGLRLLLHALPEPYAIGLDERLTADQTPRRIFTLGSYGSQYGYFLWALLLKTPDVLLLIFCCWLPALVQRYRKRRASSAERDVAVIFAATVIPGMLALSFFVHYKVGVRYAIQFLPPLFVLMGLLPEQLAAPLKAFGRPRLLRGLLGLVLLLWGWDLARSAPNFIGYYNLAAGGKARAYLYFNDSNSDWGQYRKRGELQLRESEGPETRFLYGMSGPGFGRVAIYVRDLAFRDPFGGKRAWHWLHPFQPVRTFEAAWYVFDVNEADYSAAAEAGGARVQADLAMAYLSAGRHAEARAHVAASEGQWKRLLEEVQRLLEADSVDGKEFVRLVTRVNAAQAPDLALALLNSPQAASVREPEATRQHALALGRKGRIQDAIDKVRSDAELMARPGGIWLLIGMYVREARSEEAIEVLEANPHLKQENPTMWKRMYEGALYRRAEGTRGMRGSF